MITWHKCSEKMPEVGKSIILINKDKTKIVYYTFDYTFAHGIKDWIKRHEFSHWARVQEFNFPETKDE